MTQDVTGQEMEQFAEFEWTERSHAVAALTRVLRCMKDTEMIVRVQSASSLRKFFDQQVVSDSMNEVVEEPV